MCKRGKFTSIVYARSKYQAKKKRIACKIQKQYGNPFKIRSRMTEPNFHKIYL